MKLRDNKINILFGFALLCFLLIPYTYSVLSVLIAQNSPNKEFEVQRSIESDGPVESKGNGFDMSDPYITKSPDFRKLLSGPSVSASDAVLGSINSPVTITYFGDYECVFCLEQIEYIKKVIKNDYSNKVGLVWKDFPVSNKESSIGFKTAMIARCAGDQGKFWEAQDLIINKKDSSLDEMSEELGLELNKFSECYDSDRIKNRIRENISEGNDLGIEGVPFIFINKQEIMGEVQDFELKRMIDIELKN